MKNNITFRMACFTVLTAIYAMSLSGCFLLSSDANKSTSDANKSTSDANKSTSDANKSTSDAKSDEEHHCLNLNARATLYCAVSIGNSELVKKEIDNGADLNSCVFKMPFDLEMRRAWDPRMSKTTPMVSTPKLDRIRETSMCPLHIAAVRGYTNVVKELLAAGANVNQKAGDYTPLHFAARMGNTGVVEELVAAGADVNVITKEGHTAHSLAVAGNHSNVLNALFAVGENTDEKANIANFYKQLEMCDELNKPTRKEAEYEPYSQQSRHEKCVHRSIESFRDSDKLPIIYDYCSGTEFAQKSSTHVPNPILPAAILESHKPNLERYYGDSVTGIKAFEYSFKSCIETFRIYNQDYVTSKDYFLKRLQKDYDDFSSTEEAKALRELNAQVAQATKEQNKRMQRNYIYQNSPRGKCERSCNNSYVKNSSTWNYCMSTCKDLRSDIIEQ